MRTKLEALAPVLALSMLVASWVTASFAEEVVTLPAKPQNPRAGRVLKLREVQRISDAQGGFFFKSPVNLQPAPDGGVFAVDEDQFLRFDAAGRFVVNMFRAGQGPGEFHQIENYLVRDDRILAFQASPMKLVRMGFDGRFLREVKPDASVSSLLGRLGDRLLAAAHAFPALDKVQKTEGELLDILWTLVLMDEDGHVEATALTYPTRWFAKRINARAFVSDNVTFLLCAPTGNGLAAVANEEFYVIKIVDPARSAAVRTIKRDYPRVKYEPERPKDPDAPRRMALPVSHFNDIQRLFAVDGSIWAVTSTLDPKKGVLVDVISPAGEWLDSFYLPLPKGVGLNGLARHPLTISGRTVLALEIHEDGRLEIVKSEILE